MKDQKEQLEEDAQLRLICSNCGLCFGEKKPIECNLGNPRTQLIDYQEEYRLYDNAVPNENDIIEQDSRTGKQQIVKFSEHKHDLAFTLAIPLENGFIIRKKLCSICRDIYEMWIYRDVEEHKRLTEKMKRRV